MKQLFLIVCLLGISLSIFAQKNKKIPTVGIAASLENDSLVTARGYSCIVESVGKCISPRSVSDEQLIQNIDILQALKTPVCAFNLFIPGDLKLVGPAVDEQAILEYVEIVLRRVSQTNTRMIVWGSGGARRVPEGFDKAIATQQFIEIAKKIAKIARKYGIILTLENLNSTETNFINTVKEALYVVKKVNHPNLRLDADIYHMLKEGEPPAILAKTKKYLVHVEIAEPTNRTPPGVEGVDFKPYLRVLKKIGYHNNIVIEGRWNTVPSFESLQQQIDEVYLK